MKKKSTIIIFFAVILALFLYNCREKTYPPLEETIGDTLQYNDTENVSSDILKDKKHILLYFSASWCGPCRKFTPALVRFYNEYQDEGNFEVILVTADNSENAMFQYMNKFNMPWVTVPYSDINTRRKLQRLYGGRGIPHLVLTDHSGAVLSASYVNGRYVGPRKVLSDLQELW